MARRRRRQKRTEKSCGPDASTPASSSREASFLGATVTNKPDHRGEREITVKTNCAGKAGCSGATVVTNAACFLHYTRGCGCSGHPAFPAPSVFRANGSMHRSGVLRREKAGACLELAVIASGGAKQSIRPRSKNGLLRRGARHRARIRATRCFSQ